MKAIEILLILSVMIRLPGCHTADRHGSSDPFATENLIAWCIVPFDANHRTPEQRAEMLDDLGITRLAYDYRDEHVPSFREEIGVLQEHGIELSAVWMWVEPEGEENLTSSNRSILEILEETGTETELWVSFPAQVFEGLQDSAKLNRAVIILTDLLRRAERIGCTIALYNHGEWFGEPENQLRIIKALGSDRVKMVYNFHHGHDQIERFGENLELMMPYLSAINLNGMKKEGPKIIPLGDGDRELDMIRVIRDAGYRGSIGIIGHTEGEDIRIVLERNLEGLRKMLDQVQG
jgi:sugar phosphate isomerase/epimerase